MATRPEMPSSVCALITLKPNKMMNRSKDTIAS